MKPVILISLLALLPLAGLHAQQRARYKPQVHELQLIALNASRIPAYRDGYLNGVAALTPVSGFRYTWHLRLADGLRAGVVRRTMPLEFEALRTDGMQTLRRSDLEARLGYARYLHTGAWRVHAGAEGLLNFGQARFTGINPMSMGPVPVPYEGEIRFRQAGAAVLAGASRFFGPHLSLGLEADLYAARLLSQTFSYPNPDGFQARPDAVADQQLGMNLYVT
ncbi:MAG: hypothetical protein NW241_16120, partial [Bacteroidia bacterium]|nr:hypothetical protein [Bacteroidia bacterium]